MGAASPVASATSSKRTTAAELGLFESGLKNAAKRDSGPRVSGAASGGETALKSDTGPPGLECCDACASFSHEAPAGAIARLRSPIPLGGFSIKKQRRPGAGQVIERAVFV